MLATDARVVAKELLVENAQVVNGLQTTETLFDFFWRHPSDSDDRAVLIKVIVAADDEMRARIVKATNYQNTIELSFLRGLDKIQRDIEQFLLDYGWFYDRRKNQYKNEGKPADRIVSVPYLASAVRAIALGDPAGSPRQRSRSLRDDEIYNAVFGQNWEIKVYLVCLEIVRAVEHALHVRRKIWDAPPMALAHFISYAYVCECLGKQPYEPNDVVALADRLPSVEAVERIRGLLNQASGSWFEHNKRARGVPLSKSFIEHFVRTRFIHPQ